MERKNSTSWKVSRNDAEGTGIVRELGNEKIGQLSAQGLES